MTVGLFAAIALTGIACVNSGRKSAKADTTTASNPAETVDQAALIAANAKLEAEISGLKAGRDAYMGVTLQSTAPFMLMPLMAFQAYLSHRREMKRLEKPQKRAE